MKSKGFILLESIIAMFISFLGVTILTLVVVEGKKMEKNMEIHTDRAVAMHMMNENNLNSVKIHDRIYYLNEKDED
ncbi:hypothetical protein GCM10022297_14060 [Lactobacillus hamsteri]|uniref:Type II secretion system protein n=1 Tax=Lactobacillus hamsteri DSM 5661 = JCM 6256 TaxID=1423754 RepID=A0A0R1YLU5_9LACO|nr:hypothetical protein [Lactobacillus hamsteri]KRM40188.1 hypothetical protein FC39_GL000802 [Lactobacillus hamsteri DSM 5661 = JCM 6256]